MILLKESEIVDLANIDRETSSGITLKAKPKDKLRALVLLSGGLDSTLAAKMMLEQNIDVVALSFHTGFCITAHNVSFKKTKKDGTPYRAEAIETAKELSIPLDKIDISDSFLSIVTKPKYGYGKNVNPCIDCRANMLKIAGKLLSAYDADFVVTGEVIGQRPKSQMRDTQRLIEKIANLNGRLLRPLSAKLHPETSFEKDGKIDRSKLQSINGRSRKVQMQLAKKYDIKDFPAPAGGCCFLTDENYAAKFKELIQDKKEVFPELEPEIDMNDVILMTLGRHFRIRPGLKLLVSRDEFDTNALLWYNKDRDFFFSVNTPGPVGLVDCIGNKLSKEEMELMAGITARYGKQKHSDSAKIIFSPALNTLSKEEQRQYKKFSGDETNLHPYQQLIKCKPRIDSEIEQYKIIKKTKVKKK